MGFFKFLAVPVLIAGKVVTSTISIGADIVRPVIGDNAANGAQLLDKGINEAVKKVIQKD